MPPSPAAELPAAPPLAAYCRRCGYALRGLATGRCPECGKPFDPGARRTFARRPPRLRLRRWAWRAAAVLVAVTLATGSVPAWYWWHWRAEQKTIEELRRIGGRADLGRAAPEGLARYLPERWAFLHDHANVVRLERSDKRQVEQLDLATLSHVEVLVLGSSHIDDAKLAQLHGFRELVYLNLFDNPLDGSGLAHLSRCRELIRLDVPRTRLNDAGLAQVAKLTSIQSLNVEFTDITDDGMAHLASLKSLENLDLWGTPITDAGLLRLRGMTSLRLIRVNDTKVTEQGQRELQSCLPNVRFYR